ncbi:MAG: HD domain-containing protein [Leptolinea sp.]|nr:HD domain-containing protein [Leptolinea sp.]
MKKIHLDYSHKILIYYLLFGGLWILFSDQILDFFIHDIDELTRLQSYKGWAYVAASGLLIFILLNRYIRLQKATESRLHESEERLRMALSISDQGIFDVDIPAGEIMVQEIGALTSVDETFISRIPQEKIRERIHPEDWEVVYKMYRDYVRGKIDQYRVEFRRKDQNDQWKWVLSVGSIVERDAGGHPLRFLGTFKDITDTRNAELIRSRLWEDAQRRLERITSLHEIDLEISSSSSLSTTLRKIVTNVGKHLSADAVSLLLYYKDEDIFRYADSIGFDPKRVENARVEMGRSFAGIAAKERKLVHFRNLEHEVVDEAFSSFLRQENISNYFGVPLEAKGVLVGVLEIFMRSDIDPDKEWLEFYETLAGQAALAIENARLLEGLETANRDLKKMNIDLIQANENLTSAYDATIESLAMALNLRDYETEGHSRRVTALTLHLAKILGFSGEELVNIHRGTLLHDIGKLGVPDNILRKPGLLTDEERKIMQQHPVFAYDLLKSINYLRSALDIPHLHHEKWDGSGYPYGLSREQIPLSARLFAIVDVFDALTSDRPYRKAWTKEEAIEYIKGQRGKHFDPHIVDVFLSYTGGELDS